MIPTLLLGSADHAVTHEIPPLIWTAPFALLLLSIALLPLIKPTAHWWHSNRNKLGLAVLLAGGTIAHFLMRDFGVSIHEPELAKILVAIGVPLHNVDGHYITAPGWLGAFGAFGNAMVEYIPFISLLFALYFITGGIVVRGDIPAHPVTNVGFLALGGLLASFIGTTGASMLLIRPLLNTNAERKHRAHTVVFFIFAVSNIGGCLLPIGDPPLFLGYLKGVPFLWTLGLWKEWAFMLAALLVVYFVWDSILYKRESYRDIMRDETHVRRIRVVGLWNVLWLVLAVVAVALIQPGRPLPGTSWSPPLFARELILMLFAGASMFTTPKGLRKESGFGFHPIFEVAALFLGIFVCLQVPMEILSARGGELGLHSPEQYFWATGMLSSFLDNAPTYAVFLQTAITSTTVDANAPHFAGWHVEHLTDGSIVFDRLLVAVSLGAVFFGAMTYIGNGPNFMVKSIAEERGVKMPGFFTYMLYSAAVMLPLLVAVTILFL